VELPYYQWDKNRMSDNIEFVYERMKQVVMHDIDLYHQFVEVLKEIKAEDLGLIPGDMEEMALEQLFEEWIIESKNEKVLALWHQLEPDPAVVPIMPEGPVAEKIRQMIDHYGWRAFAKGLTEYFENKRRELRGAGLFNQAEVWEMFRDRIKPIIRRRPIV
jgi:ASC-1-like (ASCH) protein